MAALASPTELGVYMQTPLEEDDARAVLILRLVSAAVVSVAGAAGETWTDEDVPDAVLGVVLAAAARRWENPSDATETRTGPFSKGWDASGWLTAEERELVAAYNTNAVNGLSSIRVEAPWGASGAKSIDPYDGEYLLQ